MGKYLISKKALQDLGDIWSYTFIEWSESQADNYYKALIASFEEIARHPGAFDKEYSEIQTGLFCHKCKKHLIFYTFSENAEVTIWRILHKRMDFFSKFR